jgi:hypothetical protein
MASGDGSVPEDGLVPCGHSQDRGPDRPQVHVLPSVREPLGVPVATASSPASTRVRQSGGGAGCWRWAMARGVRWSPGPLARRGAISPWGLCRRSHGRLRW